MKFSLIYLFLLISLFVFQGCQTVQTTELSAVIPQSAEVSDEEIRELFIKSGLGEGDGNLEKLMALPRERVVAIVQKIKDQGIKKGEKGYFSEEESERLKVKSAYFLWTLGINKEENEKYIVM